MLESIYAETFLWHVLSSDSTLIGSTALGTANNIFRNRARQGTTTNPLVYPILIYNIQSPGDINTFNQTRAFVRPLFQVRVVGRVLGIVLQDADKVQTAANRMDELLKKIERQSYTDGSQTFFYNVWREDEITPREEAGATADEFFRNYGGLYRVEVFT